MFLSIYAKNVQLRGIDVQLGFIKPEDCSWQEMESPCPFAESLISFLKELMGLWWDGMSYQSTQSHVGQSKSWLLTCEHFG
jgi:hypothetical protein